MSINRSIARDTIDFEKDSLISNLRKQIFELEQNEKNYNNLNAKYRSLQNDFNVACEDKLRQEYEFKQRLDSANKQISELKSDFEAVQQTLEERVNLNKKLYQDNSSLHRLSEDRAQEIFELKNQVSELRINLESVDNQKNQIDKNLAQTTDELNNQKTFNERLVEDNEKLSRIVDNQDFSIKNLESDKRKLLSKVEELNFEIKNITGKLKSKEENLILTNRKVDDLSKSLNQLDGKCADLEAFLEKTKLELNNSRKEHADEKNQRQEHERSIERYENIIREREKELRNAGMDIENINLLNNKLNEEKGRLTGEVNRLKNHILVLTEQNQKYIEEIEDFVAQDEKIKAQLSMRRDNAQNTLRCGKANLDKSLNNLDDYLNKSEARITSPTRYSTRAKN